MWIGMAILLDIQSITQECSMLLIAVYKLMLQSKHTNWLMNNLMSFVTVIHELAWLCNYNDRPLWDAFVHECLKFNDCLATPYG